MTQNPWIDYLYLDETVYNASELNFPHIRARAGFYTPGNESSHAPPPRNRTVRMRPMPSTRTQAGENENLRRFNLRPPTPPTLADIEAHFAAQEERHRRIEEARCAAERRNFEEALYAAQPEIFEELEQPQWRVMPFKDNNQPPPPHLAVTIWKRIFRGAFMAALFFSPLLLHVLLNKARRAARG
ncbi:hypothetical protein QBC32DRAFT_111836 [Pseudoneurospora amorphoporcata]|uniref:Uncharacterized protein n=1 Tax=Pseudoneurospora amorphoporcata TaxID=241081 RepID=A0AAN6NMV6_9PEZI|nr:hypothetical protein QBC32DRAFT_111836 [Pseudoneurospora amorphoporcata]